MKRNAVYMIIISLLMFVVVLLYMPFIEVKSDHRTEKSGDTGFIEKPFAAAWIPQKQENMPLNAEVQSKMIDAPLLCQNPDYPSGCEAVAAVMDLRYFGFNISVDTFIRDYLPLGTAPYEKDGVWYSADPDEAFLGSPGSESGMGIWAPGLASALEGVPGTKKFTVFYTYSKTLDALCRQYIVNDIPVIVWVTQNMEEPFMSLTATVEDSEKTFTWMSPNHCMLLVGFDENDYYFNDPMTGETRRYGREESEKAFRGNGSQAVIISK